MTYPYDAKRRVEALIESLDMLIKRDPEQEVQGIALPVLDAALAAIKQAKPDDPVVRSLVELMSRSGDARSSSADRLALHPQP